MAENTKRRSCTRGRHIYSLWFRHSGMSEPGEKWMTNNTKQYTVEQLEATIQSHTLTHLVLSREILPRLNFLFPNITHLCLKNLFPEEIERFKFKQVDKLSKLKVLDISDNDFSSVGLHDIFPNLTSLTTLDVHKTELTTLPMGLSSLSSLKVVKASENQFSDGLPEVISSILSLKQLDVSNCQLQSLPSSMADLINLVKLNLSGNDLSDANLSEVFSSMLNLQELNMSSCQITALPESIKDLPNLQDLDFSLNELQGGVDSVSYISSLISLNLADCDLSSLPSNFSNLRELVELDISKNDFTALPPSVYALENLQYLNVSHNNLLTTLEPELLNLKKLKTLNLENCYSITSPPYEVCRQGQHAIRQYFTDMAKGRGKNFPFVTIAVIGNTMAGKTSLIRTLQSTKKERVLTNREPGAPVDEATKVFNVEEIEVDGTVLRLIDLGGQGVYHITYQLTLRQKCIPVVVVNMQQFRDMSGTASNDREAVRRLAFDWLAHLYLANPTLGPPKLIFTHKDMFPSISEFDELKKRFLEMTNTLRSEIVDEEKEIEGEFSKIQHFVDKACDVFDAADTYCVGSEDLYAVFEDIKSTLLQSAQSFIKPLPKIWEEVNEKVLSMQSPYSSVEDIFRTLRETENVIERDQLEIILTYMHECGKVLWYVNIECLKDYVFHKISKVTKLLCVLYHNDKELWEERLSKFRPYRNEQSGLIVEKEDYEGLVNKFKNTGLLEKNLLYYWIGMETVFKDNQCLEIALSILKSFHLIHGPLTNDDASESFILPYFATGFLDTHCHQETDITLRINIVFKGLPLPMHVYHQMAIGVLENFSSDSASPVVKKNGVSVHHDGYVCRLTHDYMSSTASVTVSSTPENICSMWEKIIQITNSTLTYVLNTWSACRPVTFSICAHCLLIENPNPEKITNPKWIVRSLDITPTPPKQRSESQIECNKRRIFPVFRYPCYSMPEEQGKKITELVEDLKRNKMQPASVAGEEDSQPSFRSAEESEDSDLSDGDEYLFPEGKGDENKKFIRLSPMPTTRRRIKALFANTEKVFSMTRKRGRALIINNMNFDERPDLCRTGSDVDVENMSTMLKEFKFDVVTHTDLEAEAMLSAVKDEVKRKEHEDLGCHVLVIMTHGGVGGFIYGVDGKRVKLTDVYDLLTPLKFHGMAGQPKIVILETCSGTRIDAGDRGIDPTSELGPAQREDAEIVSPLPAQVRGDKVPGKVGYEAMNRLNYDDLLVVKASMESFTSKIDKVYGSLMIRALVSSMYKHAGHHDLYTVFKQVQTKVRKLCVDRNLDSGQLVVAWDTLTHMRKLYLFPGFKGYRK